MIIALCLPLTTKMITTIGTIVIIGTIFLGDRGNGPFSEGNYDNCRDSTKHSLIPWLVKAYTKSKFTSPLVSKLVTNQSALALGILLKIYFVFNLL